jgi:hypothetical protein
LRERRIDEQDWSSDQYTSTNQLPQEGISGTVGPVSAFAFLRARGTNFLPDEDELVEVLAKHHVTIGDGTGNLAKCWSEWQDLRLSL